jgi:hypothetical protein
MASRPSQCVNRTSMMPFRGFGFCRISPDLKTWGFPAVVSYGGRVSRGPLFNECPHVVENFPYGI